MQKTGILGYGMYIPKFRIKTGDISSVWGKDSEDIIKSLGVTEKSIAGFELVRVTPDGKLAPLADASFEKFL